MPASSKKNLLNNIVDEDEEENFTNKFIVANHNYNINWELLIVYWLFYY